MRPFIPSVLSAAMLCSVAVQAAALPDLQAIPELKLSPSLTVSGLSSGGLADSRHGIVHASTLRAYELSVPLRGSSGGRRPTAPRMSPMVRLVFPVLRVSDPDH